MPTPIAISFVNVIHAREILFVERLKKWTGNGGALSLAYHAEAIIRRIGSMKPDAVRIRKRNWVARYSMEE